MSQVDKLRTGLMGLGKPYAERTDRQRALACIILAGPVMRRLPADRHELWTAQERLHAMCSRFVISSSHTELVKLAGAIVDTDARLERLQDTAYLDELVDEREPGDRVEARPVCSCQWFECAADAELAGETDVDALTCPRIRKAHNCRKRP